MGPPWDPRGYRPSARDFTHACRHLTPATPSAGTESEYTPQQKKFIDQALNSFYITSTAEITGMNTLALARKCGPYLDAAKKRGTPRGQAILKALGIKKGAETTPAAIQLSSILSGYDADPKRTQEVAVGMAIMRQRQLEAARGASSNR